MCREIEVTKHIFNKYQHLKNLEYWLNELYKFVNAHVIPYSHLLAWPSTEASTRSPRRSHPSARLCVHYASQSKLYICFQLTDDIQATTDELDAAYNKYFGSLFRCGLSAPVLSALRDGVAGARQSFFSMQTRRFADLYAGTWYGPRLSFAEIYSHHCSSNIVNYPLFYQFMAIETHMPHEPNLVTE